MDQRIVDLYDAFTHSVISRRTLLDRLAELTGSTAAAFKAAADLARSRTIVFFKDKLGVPPANAEKQVVRRREAG